MPQTAMNYPAAELRGIKMNFYLINPDAEHRGILLIKNNPRIDANNTFRFVLIYLTGRMVALGG